MISLLIYIMTSIPGILFTLLTLIISYQFIFRYWNYFTIQNVKFDRGLPLLGTMYKLLLGITHIGRAFQESYNKFPNERFYGIYDFFGIPTYVIRDPELIRQITIKDFDHFSNHRMFISEDSDPLFGRSLFVMRDARWRDMRSTLSPSFTGRKMRLMLSLLNECSEAFITHVKEEVGKNVNASQTYELRDLFSRFSNDSIASCAFGIKVNSLVDRENEFFSMGKIVTQFEGIQGIKFLGFQTIPKIMKFLRVRFFTEDQTNYFRNLVHGNMRYREENHIIRHDMINLLMESKKQMIARNLASSSGADVKNIEVEEEEDDEDIGFATVKEAKLETNGTSSRKTTQFEDDDYVSQCLIFFFAGFNAISLAQCFMAHELGVNPEIQSRLYEEIMTTEKELKATGKSLTYEALQKLKYLDMIVSETLRRWSLGPASDRFCNKAYELENSDGSRVQLNPGDGLWIPTYAIHLDPQYFPDPERFDPERFSPENHDQIQPGTYMPFGIGPRNCIASRFALMGVKVLFYHLLTEFTLEKCEKTQDPLRLKNSVSTNLLPEKGFYLNLKLRK